MVLMGIVITVTRRAVLLAHKRVPSSEEVMFTLDLDLKSLAKKQHKKYLSPVARVYVLC